MTNLTSLCSAAEQNAQCCIQKHPLIPDSFTTKLSLHMSLLASDPTRLLQVNMPDGREKW